MKAEDGRPDDVPEDVWEAAEEVWLTLPGCGGVRDNETEHIASAILAACEAQKERDAKIADNAGAQLNERAIGSFIATAIRTGGKP